MLCYCKKCGRIVLFIFDNERRICDYCESETYPVPKEFLLDEFGIKEELKQQFLEEYVKTSSEFDQYLFDQRGDRDEILAKQFAEFNAKMAVGKALSEGKKVSRQEILSGKLNDNRTDVSCPYCHSTNTSKIGTLSRVVSTGLFGFASKKIGKQWHCNKCGSDF